MALSPKISLHRFGSPRERRDALAADGWLDIEEWRRVSDLTEDGWTCILDDMVENVIETFRMPLSIATGFVVNGDDRLVPMVTEERTVVAAASKAAKLCRPKGFHVRVRPSIAIAQLLYPRPMDPDAVARVVARQGATAQVDGALGWGQPAARLATATAIELAADHGIGAVAIVNCNHIGRVGESSSIRRNVAPGRTHFAILSAARRKLA